MEKKKFKPKSVKELLSFKEKHVLWIMRVTCNSSGQIIQDFEIGA